MTVKEFFASYENNPADCVPQDIAVTYIFTNGVELDTEESRTFVDKDAEKLIIASWDNEVAADYADIFAADLISWRVEDDKRVALCIGLTADVTYLAEILTDESANGQYKIFCNDLLGYWYDYEGDTCETVYPSYKDVIEAINEDIADAISYREEQRALDLWLGRQ